jgi:hypothetical protein
MNHGHGRSKTKFTKEEWIIVMHADSLKAKLKSQMERDYIRDAFKNK